MGCFHACPGKINSGPLRWCNLTNQSLTKAKANSPLIQECVLYFGVFNRSHSVSLMFSKELERGGVRYCSHRKTRALEIYASVYIFRGHEGSTFYIYLQPIAATWRIRSFLSDVTNG